MPRESAPTGLGGALLVEDIELGDGEARVSEQVDDRAGEVTAAEEALVHRLQTMLPAPYVFVGGQTVFDEMQGSAWLENPAHLPQGDRHVGDGAQGPGRQRCVATVVGEGQRTGTFAAARRLRASLHPTSAGSIAATPLTAAG